MFQSTVNHNPLSAEQSLKYKAINDCLRLFRYSLWLDELVKLCTVLAVMVTMMNLYKSNARFYILHAHTVWIRIKAYRSALLSYVRRMCIKGMVVEIEGGGEMNTALVV